MWFFYEGWFGLFYCMAVLVEFYCLYVGLGFKYKCFSFYFSCFIFEDLVLERYLLLFLL